MHVLSEQAHLIVLFLLITQSLLCNIHFQTTSRQYWKLVQQVVFFWKHSYSHLAAICEHIMICESFQFPLSAVWCVAQKTSNILGAAVLFDLLSSPTTTTTTTTSTRAATWDDLSPTVYQPLKSSVGIVFVLVLCTILEGSTVNSRPHP